MTFAATRAETLAYGRRFLGVSESPPYSNNVLFSRWWGFSGAWCLMYVDYVLDHVGNALPITTPGTGTAYNPTAWQWYLDHGMAHSGLAGAQPGDIVFWDFPGEAHSPNHANFLIELLAGGMVHTLDGNTGSNDRDGGSVQERVRPGARVVGHARLPYPAAQPPAQETRYKPFPGHTLNVGSTGPDVATLKLYLILSGVAPELALQSPTQLVRFGARTTADAVIRFKRTWNALAHQSPGDKLYLGPTSPAVGPVTWQCLVFSVAARAART